MADSTGIPQLEVLADRFRLPGALRIGFEGVDQGVLLALSGDPEFLALTRRIPCRMPAAQYASLAADLQALFVQADCGPLDAGKVEAAPVAWPAVLAGDKHWVAGDWYLSPPDKPSAHQLASRALALRLVQLVAADADNHEIEALLRQDPGLSYHLLRLVNSPGIGVGRQVSSYAQAIAILGRAHLRRWLNLLLFAASKDDKRSAMLLARAALRARRMELLEKARGGDRVAQEQAFITGMFSLLGVLFGAPLEEVLKPLHLDAGMVGALCRQEGALGRQLQFALLLESPAAMQTPEFRLLLAEQEIPVRELTGIGFAAANWMLEAVGEASGARHA